MDSIIQKIFKKSYLENKFGMPIINIFNMRLDLEKEYKIKFVYSNKLKDILLEGNFIREHIDSDGYCYLTKGRRKMIDSVDKEDVLKSIDILFLNIIRSRINCEYKDIQIFIANSYGIDVDHEQIAYYAGMISSERKPDKELIKTLIIDRKNITSEIIKKVSSILELDESKTAILLAENGYKFKILESDIKNVSLSREKIQELTDIEIKNLISSDKIDYEKVIELCSAINYREEQLEKIISTYSFKEKEITRNLERFVLSYNLIDLGIFCHHAKVDLIPMIMLIGNIKNI